MRRFAMAVSIAVTLLLVRGLPGSQPLRQSASLQPSTASLHYPDAFPDSIYPHRNPAYIRDDAHPEKSYPGPTFQLSQNYPHSVPYQEQDYPWLRVDFKDRRQYIAYLRSVLRYAYQDNLKNDWYTTNTTHNNWFHAPWMHLKQDSVYKDHGEPIFLGREFIHGMTFELPSKPYRLSPRQKDPRQNWAVSLYNARGAITIGHVWEKVRHNEKLLPEDCQFLPGTVAVKLLFTEANVQDMPMLAGAPEWEAHIFIPDPNAANRTDPTAPPFLIKPLAIGGKKRSVYQRTVTKLRLLQIDVAVRDPRAPTGWVFGTFVYMASPSGIHRKFTGLARGDKMAWDDVVPVGVIWGNDVENVPGSGLPFHEMLRNEEAPAYAGWGGRLNGPVDNAQSSCLACHGTGLTKRIPNNAFAPNFPDSPEFAAFKEFKPYQNWAEGDIPPEIRERVTRTFFRNQKRGEPFLPQYTSTDFSLQLSEGLHNYENNHALTSTANGEPLSALQP